MRLKMACLASMLVMVTLLAMSAPASAKSRYPQCKKLAEVIPYLPGRFKIKVPGPKDDPGKWEWWCICWIESSIPLIDIAPEG